MISVDNRRLILAFVQPSVKALFIKADFFNCSLVIVCWEGPSFILADFNRFIRLIVMWRRASGRRQTPSPWKATTCMSAVELMHGLALESPTMICSSSLLVSAASPPLSSSCWLRSSSTASVGSCWFWRTHVVWSLQSRFSRPIYNSAVHKERNQRRIKQKANEASLSAPINMTLSLPAGFKIQSDDGSEKAIGSERSL